MKMIRNFLRNEEGMETLEYALVAGLIAAVAVVVYSADWTSTLAEMLIAAVNPEG